jgi:hypothetical protein
MSSSNVTEEVFARMLDELKRRGSSLLILGSPDPTLRRTISRRLLGDGSAETRRRLFVHAGDPVATPDVAAGPANDGTARVVARSTETRASAASSPSPTAGSPSGIPRRTVDGGRLGTLASVVGEEIHALERRAVGFSPGELRLCVDSLDPMLADRSASELRRFAEATGNRVRAASGMAHSHLSVDRSSAVVGEIAPAFDGLIELRSGVDGSPEHRWTFTDRDVESGWITL